MPKFLVLGRRPAAVQTEFRRSCTPPPRPCRKRPTRSDIGPDIAWYSRRFLLYVEDVAEFPSGNTTTPYRATILVGGRPAQFRNQRRAMKLCQSRRSRLELFDYRARLNSFRCPGTRYFRIGLRRLYGLGVGMSAPYGPWRMGGSFLGPWPDSVEDFDINEMAAQGLPKLVGPFSLPE